jgi:hypothetical protein
MANEKVTQLPTVTSALAADIIYAVQAGTSVQETLQQVINLSLSQTILSYAGNPNGLVAGNTYQLLWDTTDLSLWVCTTSGSSSTAVWTQISPSASSPVDPVHGGTGVASPTAHTLPVAEGSADFNFLGPLANGEILIGSTGFDPVPTTLTAGSGITIANNAGSITITATGASGFTWNDVTSPTQAMLPNNGYLSDDPASLVTLSLPVTANFGDIIIVIGRSSMGWSINQNAGQSIIVSGTTSTVGVGGSVSSTLPNNTINLICTVANTEFTAISVMGNLTIV